MSDAPDPFPINANPGGQIDPDDHIGHGVEFDAIMRSTMRSGALLTGDRRMGKTSMLSLVERELRAAGHVVIRMSAETEHLDVFASRLMETVKTEQRFRDEARNWDLEVDVERYGFRLKRNAPKAKDRSTHSDDLFTWAVAAAKPARLVLILDEVTVLAHEIHKKDPGAGREFLRSLRRARQMPDGPIMIFAGSIGMHHALDDNSPVNDLTPVHIGPLAPGDAVFLARCLLLGEQIPTADPDAVARAIAVATDGIAFYIHHIVEAVALRSAPVDSQVVDAVVTAAIENPDDPWQLEHYYDRLGDYYGDGAVVAAALLDYVATNQPVEHQAILDHFRTLPSSGTMTDDQVIDLVAALERDHYLRRAGLSNVFASELLRRSWRWTRRLS